MFEDTNKTTGSEVNQSPQPKVEDIFSDVNTGSPVRPQVAQPQTAPAATPAAGLDHMKKRLMIIGGGILAAIVLVIAIFVAFDKLTQKAALIAPLAPVVTQSKPVVTPEVVAPAPVVAAPEIASSTAIIATSSEATLDSDHDGLTDQEEKQLGTDPNSPDTDGDGLTDFDEVRLYHTNPLSADTDGDGVIDGVEVKQGTNPNGSGPLVLSGQTEVNNLGQNTTSINTTNINTTTTKTIPVVATTTPVDLTLDSDHDGLTDVVEKQLGTDPRNPDTDGDGLIDGAEVNIYHTNPLNPDTDGDGYKDGVEVKSGYNPNGPGKLK